MNFNFRIEYRGGNDGRLHVKFIDAETASAAVAAFIQDNTTAKIRRIGIPSPSADDGFVMGCYDLTSGIRIPLGNMDLTD